MPPVSATVVENGARPLAARPKNRSTRFRIVMVLWPLIAVGGAAIWHFRGESRGKSELRDELVRARTTLDERDVEIQRLKRESDDTKAILGEKGKLNDNAYDARTKAEEDRTKTLATLQQKDSKLTAALANIERLRKDNELLAPSTQEVLVLRATTQSDQKKMGELQKRLSQANGEGVAEGVFDLNGDEAVALEISPKAPVPDSLSLVPNDLPEKLGTIDISDKNVISVRSPVKDSSPSSGPTTKIAANDVLCSIKIRDRKILIKRDPRLADFPGLKSWLSLAQVKIMSNQKEVAKLSLRRTSEGTFVVNDEETGSSALSNAHVTSWVDMQFGDPAQLPQGWQASFPKDSERKILRLTDSESKIHFDITLNADSMKIETSWRNTYKTANDLKKKYEPKTTNLPAKIAANKINTFRCAFMSALTS